MSPTVAGLAITTLIMVGLIVFGPGENLRSMRRVLGLAPSHSSHTVDFVPGQGTFQFLLTQRGSDEPVGYDPCRPIEYVVNPAGAPADWGQLIDTAVSHTETASGLRFQYVGTTEQRPFDAAQRGLVGGVRSPAVIGFADADEIPELAGEVAGVGGSQAAGLEGQRLYYVTGSVALDTAVFDHASTGDDRVRLQAIVDHEFGHLVGLDHVASGTELMSPVNVGQTWYGPGDLEGLARLGAIPCR